MFNEAKSGENVRRPRSSENMHQDPLVVAEETSSLATLEHYLYGKNVVRALDMQNIQQQRTSDQTAFEKNNNETATLSKGIVQKFCMLYNYRTEYRDLSAGIWK